MLENIRENSQGLVAKIILGFIILTFAVAGIGSYTNSVDTSVAEVNGQKISQQSFDQAYQAQRNRMVQQFGEMFDTLASDPAYMANFRKGVLDNLVNEILIDQSARDLAIRVSDEQIKQTIRTMPEFQVDGTFDNNRYLAVINQAGFFQSSDFRDYLRTEMSRRQLSQALVTTEFSLPYQTQQLSALQNQTRDISVATVSAEQFKATVDVSEEEINNFYMGNQARFENPEQVKVEYVSLDVEQLSKGVEVSDGDAQGYYDENISDFQQQEQRRVSHILIEFGDDEAAAEAQAGELLAKVNAGEDFAALAKANSADAFSGENGGDLEWIERGVMGDAFDDAAFALASAGDVSEVVKSDFGFHIIKLTELKPTQTTPFVEVKEEILARIKNDKAQEQFFELQQELARVSFEFPDSLDDAAGAVDGEVQTSVWLTRGNNPAPFNVPAVVDAAFSDLVLTENLNSDIIEVSDTLVMVVRLAEHKPAAVRPLEEVEAQIKTQLVNQKASSQAQTLADEMVAKLQSGESIDSQLAELGAEFAEHANTARFGSSLDQAVIRKAFVMPHPEGTATVDSAELANGDLAIITVKAVKAGEAIENANLSEQKASQLAQSAYQGYVDTLRATAEIKQRQTVQETNVF